jgi:hypothetical protein
VCELRHLDHFLIFARPVFEGTEQACDPLSWQKDYAQNILGETLALEGHKQEAAPLLKAGFAQIEQQKDFIPAYHRKALEEARKWATSSN